MADSKPTFDPEPLVLALDLEDRFAGVRWDVYQAPDPADRNLAVSDVSLIMKDFDKLQRADPDLAAQVWDKSVPDYLPRPSGLPGPIPEPEPVNMIEPGRRRRRAQTEALLEPSAAVGARAAQDRSDPAAGAEQTKSDTKGGPSAEPARRAPEPAVSHDDDPRGERARMLLEGLERRFLRAEEKYHFRDGRKEVAFEAQDKTLRTAYDTPAIVSAMIDVAETRGWSSLKLTGTEEFRREAWLQASVRDFETSGYRPTKLDKVMLDELRAERGATTQTNTLADQPKATRAPEPIGRFDKLNEDGGPEPRLPLTPAQDQHLRLMETTMRHRGDAPEAISRAREIATGKLTRERVHVGTLVEVGSGPYQDKPGQKPSHYVTLQDEQGQRSKVWGVDLPRALHASGAEPGEKVAVVFRGRQPVQVGVPFMNQDGDVLAHRSKTVDRNSWEIVPFDRLREDARVSIGQALQRQGNPANVKVFDRQAAPMRQATPAVSQRQRSPSRDRERAI